MLRQWPRLDEAVSRELFVVAACRKQGRNDVYTKIEPMFNNVCRSENRSVES